MNSRAEADAAEKIGELSSVSSLLLRYSSCLISEKCIRQIKKKIERNRRIRGLRDEASSCRFCTIWRGLESFAQYGDVVHTLILTKWLLIIRSHCSARTVMIQLTS